MTQIVATAVYGAVFAVKAPVGAILPMSVTGASG